MKDVKITDVRVTLRDTRVKGNFADSTRQVETIGFAVVEVDTNVGITGIGVTYHEVGGEAIREFIRYAIKPKFIGRNPFETEMLYEENFHYMRGVGRKGLAFCAYSAVDIALWDIKGKLLNMPLYRLLGGNDPVVPIYASGGWTSYSTEELVAEARKMVAQGYTKIKLKVGVDGGRNPMEDVRRVAAVREAIAMTQAWNKAYAPHGMEHIHMHLVAAAPNGIMLERLLMFEHLVNNVYLDAPKPKDKRQHRSPGNWAKWSSIPWGESSPGQRSGRFGTAPT